MQKTKGTPPPPQIKIKIKIKQQLWVFFSLKVASGPVAASVLGSSLYCIAQVATSQRILVTGGGGSARTGLCNRLVVFGGLQPSASIALTQAFEVDMGTTTVMNFAIHPQGNHVLCGMDSRCVLYRLGDGAIEYAKSVEADYEKTPHQRIVRYNRKGDRFATVGEDSRIRIWKHPTMGIRLILAGPGGHDGQVQDITWSPSGTQLVSTGKKDRSCKVWNAVTGGLLRTLTVPVGDAKATFYFARYLLSLSFTIH